MKAPYLPAIERGTLTKGVIPSNSKGFITARTGKWQFPVVTPNLQLDYLILLHMKHVGTKEETTQNLENIVIIPSRIGYRETLVAFEMATK